MCLVKLLRKEEINLKHDYEIYLQRLINSQNAMRTIKENLVTIQNRIQAGWKAEEVMNDIDEIIMFVNWAVQQ